MPDRRHYHIVINPVSGRRSVRSLVARLIERLESAGMPVRLHRTRGPGCAGEVARQACADGATALIVAGGDGTISDAIEGMDDRGVPILPVGSGTENIIAKYLGLRASIDRLWAALQAGRTTTIDVGLMNGRRFLIVAGVGFDAEVVRRLEAARRGNITYLSYFWPLWRTYWDYRHPWLTVEADGETVFEGRGMAFVGGIPRYALGLKLLREAQANDGLLDVCVFPCVTRRQLVGHAVRTLCRAHIGRGGVVYRQARSIRIHSPQAVGIELDGDGAGRLPAAFSIAPRPAQFITAPDRMM